MIDHSAPLFIYNPPYISIHIISNRSSHQILSIIGCSIHILYLLLSCHSSQHAQCIYFTISAELDVCLEIVTDHKAFLFLQIQGLNYMFQDERIWFSCYLSLYLSCLFDCLYHASAAWDFAALDHGISIRICTDKLRAFLDVYRNENHLSIGQV